MYRLRKITLILFINQINKLVKALNKIIPLQQIPAEGRKVFYFIGDGRIRIQI